LATALSVAVAVGAVVATWVSADASRIGYRRLTETLDGAPSIDIATRAGGRFDVGQLPQLADIPGVRAVVPLFFRPTLLRVGEKRVREVAVGVDAAALVEAGLLTLTSGRPCEAADEVVLDAALAEGLAKRIGDEVIMFARRSIRRMTVVGLADSQSLKWFAEGGGVVVGSTGPGFDPWTGRSAASPRSRPCVSLGSGAVDSPLNTVRSIGMKSMTM
jgi:hypothetical protein